MTFLTVLAAAFAVAAPAAFAAAPANDDRTTATALTLPKELPGTTTEATMEVGEPVSRCEYNGVKGSVWYSLKGVNRLVVAAVEAEGDLDAVVDVFVRTRSQLSPVGCATTNSRGIGAADFKASYKNEYLIRVSQRINSVPGNFTLKVATAADPAKAPGAALPSRGVSDSVNFARNPSDAWAKRLTAGTTYRVNLVASSGGDGHCVGASLYAPRQFERDAAVRLTCGGGYTLFTPKQGQSGRYTMLVQGSSRTLDSQRYHLEIAPAQLDDTSPGYFWIADAVRGRLTGSGIDVVDLYNWHLDHVAFADLKLRSKHDFDLRLMSVGGGVLSCGCAEGGNENISRRLKPGEYYVAVDARSGERGAYKLSRLIRTITHTRLTFNGAVEAFAAPHWTVSITATVTPAVTGKAVITLERHDPIDGWQFERQFTGSVAGGSFSASFVPKGIGRWRANAVYKGTRTSNKSVAKPAFLRVKR